MNVQILHNPRCSKSRATLQLLQANGVEPDVILYLRAEVKNLVTRVIHGRGLNYWEAGMDIQCASNLYNSFIDYQTLLREQFDIMAEEYNFITINADRSAQSVFKDLQRRISPLFSQSEVPISAT